ncbi:alpha/beta hydrolase [Sphingomonas sp. ST-64]|uniref:Alpha/beta hydrolase n=1 Tax=Sphingomonas plantiphila TaxID=3163295 RepID=A0ABW8YK80_9SPHN
MADAPMLAEGIADYLDAVRRPPEAAVSLEAARLIADRDAHRIAGPRPAGMRVTDSYVPDVAIETAVRIYRPAGDGALPAVLYLHGGGFTIGSIETYDCLAAALAKACGAVVVSVHYARLPESTPGATIAQCHGVLRWIARMADRLTIDPARIAVAGDSAGACLATHVAMRARDGDGPALIGQLLCYGVYALDPKREAYARAHDPGLPRAVIDAMIATWQDCAARDATIVRAPLNAELAGLPPAILLAAEHDPMRAEGDEFAAALRAAGVVVETRSSPGMCHGFLRAQHFSAPARAEMQWLGAAFRTLLQSTHP